mmetsp:Transcript_13279/g.47658  ORF Transcript_13279/g.47658 Transcript_13279/m.47658 type:complete len:238 (+) Transcript_13279:1160-1873(+)
MDSHRAVATTTTATTTIARERTNERFHLTTGRLISSSQPEVLVVHRGELILRGDHPPREPPGVQRRLRPLRALDLRELEVHEPLAVLVHVAVRHRAVFPALVLHVLRDVVPPLRLRLLFRVEQVLQQQRLRRDRRPGPEHALRRRQRRRGHLRRRQLRRLLRGDDAPGRVHAGEVAAVGRPGEPRHQRRASSRVHPHALRVLRERHRVRLRVRDGRRRRRIYDDGRYEHLQRLPHEL